MAYKTPAPLTVTTTQFDVLVGDANNTIASVGPGTSNQLLQSGGAAANPVYSTATYPPTATGTGKILRADGTNWVASTATYPNTAGTSGNYLTSDGTNWSSTAPASSPNGYTIPLINYLDAGAPADGQTYFQSWGTFHDVQTSGKAVTRMYIPVAGTVTKVYGAVVVNGTLGSNENCTLYLRLNNTTDTTITNTLQLTAVSNTFNATVSISVSAGDYLEYKFVCPTWATNPTLISFTSTLYVS